MPRRRFARQAAPALLVLLTFGVTMHAEVPALLAPFQFLLGEWEGIGDLVVGEHTIARRFPGRFLDADHGVRGRRDGPRT